MKLTNLAQTHAHYARVKVEAPSNVRLTVSYSGLVNSFFAGACCCPVCSRRDEHVRRCALCHLQVLSTVVGRSRPSSRTKFNEVDRTVDEYIEEPDKERLSVMLIAAIAPTSGDANAFAVGHQQLIHAHTPEVAVKPYLVHVDLKGNMLNFSLVSDFMAAHAIMSRFILMSWTGWMKPFHGVLANFDLR